MRRAEKRFFVASAAKRDLYRSVSLFSALAAQAAKPKSAEARHPIVLTIRFRERETPLSAEAVHRRTTRGGSEISG